MRLFVNGAMMIASFAFLFYIVYSGWDALRAHLQSLNYWLLAAALLLYPLGFLPTMWGWHTIMRRLGCGDMRTNMRLYSLSCLPKRIPGAIWYISSRVMLYQEHQVSSATTLLATAIETAFLTLSGFSVYLLGLGVGSGELDPRLRGIAVAVCILLLAIPLWTPLLSRRMRWLQARMGILSPVEFSSYDAFKLLGISGVAWLGGGVLLYILANSVMTTSALQLPNVIGSWGAAGAISLTIGWLVQGMGIREITLTVLLKNYMPLSVAAVVSILFRLLLTGGEFMWALVFAWLTRQSPE